ncbi:MAG: tetratricopeptide repeat protein [Chitinivibrionales bacterium]|nr:tetratricopeptide repeat protein [Chitinivibrionales bacterium]
MRYITKQMFLADREHYAWVKGFQGERGLFCTVRPNPEKEVRGEELKDMLLITVIFIGALIAGCGGRHGVSSDSEDPAKRFIPSSGKSLVVLVRPGTYFSEKIRSVKVNDEKMPIRKVDTLMVIPVVPGECTIIPSKTRGKPETLKITEGEIHFLADRKDALSMRDLGNVSYDRGNTDSALVYYRRAMELDPALRGHEVRYAEVVLDRGDEEEIMAALKAAIKTGNASPKIYAALGEKYISEKKYDEAVPVLEKALRIDASHVGVLTALATAEAYRGNNDRALTLSEKAVSVEPKTVMAYRLIGDVNKVKKLNERSINAYRMFLDNGGKSNALSQKVGTHLYNNKEYEDAARYLAMTKGKRGHQFKHQLRLAQSEFHSGKYDDAIPRYKKLIARGPKRSIRIDVMKKLALAYTETGEPKKAIYWIKQCAKITREKDSETAYLLGFHNEKLNSANAKAIYESNIREFPDDYRNFLRLGMMLARDKKTAARSVKMLQRAMNLAGSIPSAWLEIARVYGLMGEKDKELSAYRTYVKSAPQSVEANLRIGMLLMQQGKSSEGISYIETAHKISPDNVRTQVALAEAYNRMKRTGEAMDLLIKARSQRPNEVSIRRKIYEAYRRLGKNDKAIEELKALLELQPDPGLLFTYARLTFKQKQYAETENAIQNLLATDPENIEALLLLGKVLRINKEYERAVDAYKEIDYISPRYPAALFERAETHLEQGKPHWAKEFFERALKSDPRFAHAHLGLAKVARLRKNRTSYEKHILQAYKIDPKDSEVLAAYNSIRK